MSNNNELFHFAEEYLKSIRPSIVSDKEFASYFKEDNPAKTMKEITKGLFHSLQNSQMMPKVIGFNKEENKEKFDKLLFDYDANTILNEYKTGEKLYKIFQENFTINNADSKNNLWKRFAFGVISGCEFLSTFKNVDEFNDFVNLFQFNIHTQIALPLLLEKEIYGLGFALACDFLKELGYKEYPKPDVHLMDVFEQLGLASRDELSVYRAIIKMANEVGRTPYDVDKVFWLICSGRWYRHKEFTGEDLEIDGKKKEFIEMAKDNFGI